MIQSFSTKLVKRFSFIYNKFSGLGTAQSLVIGFFLIILIGAFLLSLPFATTTSGRASFIDALFTSTSAICVTGLVVVNTYTYWSLFGKIVILFLIQIGGIGFMTLVTALFLFVGRRITLRDRLLIQESYNQSHITGMVKLVKNIIKGTLIIEGIGAFLLFIVFFNDGYSFIVSIWKGIFISVSAFCNAGFDIIGSESLSAYVNNPLLNFTVMFLIILGGIGFAVWLDLIKLKQVFTKKISFKLYLKRLSLHTKIALLVTIWLIFLGFFATFLLEYNNPYTIGDMPLHEQLLASLFQSVTLRTAGFNTIDFASLKESTKAVYITQMFIGGSPGGTAGGIKTTTFGVIFVAVWSVVHGKNKLEIFNRSISYEILLKAISVIMLNLTIVVGAAILLSITEVGMDYSYRFIELLFECSSAVATVGLTVGITPYLSDFGKCVIIFCMFIGRLGPVTLVVAFARQSEKNKVNINYPSENILVG